MGTPITFSRWPSRARAIVRRSGAAAIDSRPDGVSTCWITLPLRAPTRILTRVDDGGVTRSVREIQAMPPRGAIGPGVLLPSGRQKERPPDVSAIHAVLPHLCRTASGGAWGGQVKYAGPRNATV